LVGTPIAAAGPVVEMLTPTFICAAAGSAASMAIESVDSLAIDSSRFACMDILPCAFLETLRL
jgi:hypothetical protein